MAKVRKRTWTSGKGKQTAWVADYFDKDGKRHIKTFAREREAKAWLVAAQGEVARGVHTPENASITVAEAAELWVGKGELEKLERSTLRQYRNHVDLHIVPSRSAPRGWPGCRHRRSRRFATIFSARARGRWRGRCWPA